MTATTALTAAVVALTMLLVADDSPGDIGAEVDPSPSGAAIAARAVEREAATSSRRSLESVLVFPSESTPRAVTSTVVPTHAVAPNESLIEAASGDLCPWAAAPMGRSNSVRRGCGAESDRVSLAAP